ncbi:MAG: endo-1,4-beta-xylanase [bacterium]|nr:endo-1,4-beta-xylanase [bacterium]
MYLSGETVTVQAPKDMPTSVRSWRARDDGNQEVARGAFENGDAGAVVSLGELGVGWYRVEFLDNAGACLAWTSTAVLAPLSVPVPQDSPICVDSATAWFARGDAAKQEAFARLAALAGVNWIRDRMTWASLEPEQGAFVGSRTGYDTAATLQAEQGLKVLQVFHGTPGWAADTSLDGDEAGGRFPRDLRDQYRFCKAMAERYEGRVLAWEPWNEANITHFGGHPIYEMCALQKAAYLGFKAGDPNVVVCWNVFAGSGSENHNQGVIENEAWPYFETYNIHSYGRPSGYLNSFRLALETASGRPLWISECGVRLPHVTGAPWGDLSREDELRQAEFLAVSYASSLYAGVNRHFFFILGNYLERGIQFGLLRHDLTPRPGYVALAAIGRFLAGARCIGRLPEAATGGAQVIAFRAWPDGVERDVLVAWSEEETEWPIEESFTFDGVYTHLGRPLASPPKRLGSAPLFLIAQAGELDAARLETPPVVAPWRDGTPSPVVLQVELPKASTMLAKQAHEVMPGREVSIPVWVYNFGDGPVTGSLALDRAPKRWHVNVPDTQVTLAPLERKQVMLQVVVAENGRDAVSGGWIRISGQFDGVGEPVLAFRLAVAASKLKPSATHPIPGAHDATRWQDNIMRGAAMSHETDPDGGVRFAMQFRDTDPWAYPRLNLADEERPPAGMEGLSLVVEVEEGMGDVRVQFIEDSGATYLAEVAVNPELRTPQRVTATFETAQWGSYSRPDPDGVLQPETIRTVLVGVNSRKQSTFKMSVRDLAWVRY